MRARSDRERRVGASPGDREFHLRAALVLLDHIVITV